MPSSASFMRSFHADLNQEQAIELIKKQESTEREGSFLVTPCINQQYPEVKFVITVGLTNVNQVDCPVKLLYINSLRNCTFSLKNVTEDIPFKNLYDLIDYHVMGGNGAEKLKRMHQCDPRRDVHPKNASITGSSLQMCKPINNKNPGERESWFHAGIFGFDAVKILGQEHVKKGSFLVRYSYLLGPQRYTLSVRVEPSENFASGVRHVVIEKFSRGWCLSGVPRISGVDLKSLVESLENEVIDKSGNPFSICLKDALTYARNTSIINATDIDSHLKNLKNTMIDDDTPGFSDISLLESEWEKLEPSEVAKKMNLFDPVKSSLNNPKGTNFKSTLAGEDIQNSMRNRYQNILPYDHSRVVLKYGIKYPYLKMSETASKNMSDEYVNANLIGRLGTQNRGKNYVACQGPLDGKNPKGTTKKSTITDFWRTVVVSKVRIIIMATGLQERGQHKCGKYWPEVGEGVKGYYQKSKKDWTTSEDSKPIINVRQINDPTLADNTIYKERKFFVQPLLIEQVGDGNLVNGWEVIQYEFKKWPDHGVLQEPYDLIEFLQKVHLGYELLVAVDKEFDDVNKGMKDRLTTKTEVDKAMLYNGKANGPNHPFSILRADVTKKMKGKKFENKAENTGSSSQAGPLLVHCSAGVGRTGTFIAIDMLMDRLRWFGMNSEIDIHGAIQHIRNYRPCTVQTAGQYEFIYKAMKCYVQGLVVSNFKQDEEDGGQLMKPTMFAGRKNQYTIKKNVSSEK